MRMSLALAAALWGSFFFSTAIAVESTQITGLPVQAETPVSLATLLPPNPDQNEAGPKAWQVAGALSYVVILGVMAIVGVRYLRRRKELPAASGGSGDGVQLLCTRRVGLTSAVHVLEIKGKTIVMATHGANVELLQLREPHEA